MARRPSTARNDPQVIAETRKRNGAASGRALLSSSSQPSPLLPVTFATNRNVCKSERSAKLHSKPSKIKPANSASNFRKASASSP